jgi:hypothetical protein
MDRDTGMKDGLAAIVGRRIAGVVVAQSPHGPRQQVFLVFDDGARFELYVWRDREPPADSTRGAQRGPGDRDPLALGITAVEALEKPAGLFLGPDGHRDREGEGQMTSPRKDRWAGP